MYLSMKKVLEIVTNKFLLTAIVFGVWMLYFDQNDWFSMRRRNQELQGVKDNITYLTTEIAKMEKEKTGMVSDPQILEQYAREHYQMKRDSEDLYIIEEQ